MPPKNKPLTKSELAAYDSKRDLATELLQSIREMKAGQIHVVSSPAIEACKTTGFSQS
jgi:putative transcriptional regulator